MRDVLVVTSACVALLTGPGAIAGSAAGQACLSGFCVGDPSATEKTVVKKLGTGTRLHRPDDVGESRCYFDPVSGVWADFTFAGKEESKKGDLRGLMLTEQRMCEGRGTGHKANLGRQLAGAAIGMAESEVLAVIGRPTRIDDAREREERKPSMADTRYSAKFGERVYVYEKPDDLGFTFVFFKDGRVRTIWFSNSE